MANTSFPTKTITLSPSQISGLSMCDLDWESTSHSEYDDYSEFENLNDVEDSIHGTSRWKDRTKVSDEIPELIRRRQSVDQVDAERQKVSRRRARKNNSSNNKWDDKARVLDEIPELIRRRQSVDQMDNDDDEENLRNSINTDKSQAKLGERIRQLGSSPTHSPRSVLNEVLDLQVVKGGAGDSAEETGSIDDLSLDDSIYTVEDEMEYIRTVLESSQI